MNSETMSQDPQRQRRIVRMAIAHAVLAVLILALFVWTQSR